MSFKQCKLQKAANLLPPMPAHLTTTEIKLHHAPITQSINQLCLDAATAASALGEIATSAIIQYVHHLVRKPTTVLESDKTGDDSPLALLLDMYVAAVDAFEEQVQTSESLPENLTAATPTDAAVAAVTTCNHNCCLR